MKKTIAAIAITITVAAASISLAYGPMHNGPWGGPMMGNRYNQNFTADQQKQIKQIEQKYQQQLTEKETAIKNKSADLDKALRSDSTTIGTTNQLRSELYDLEQDYWQLRTTIDQEIGGSLGVTYRGFYGWGPGYCSWHDDHGGMYGNDYTNQYNRGMNRGYDGRHMAYGPGNCRW